MEERNVGEKLEKGNDYRLCPICVAALIASGHTRADEHLAECGSRCAWWDEDKDRCAALSICGIGEKL